MGKSSYRKYSQELLDNAKKSAAKVATDALKTASKKSNSKKIK